MKTLTLTFLVASAAVALATVSTSARVQSNSGHAQTLAMACCDDPPPPCLPGYPPCNDDKTNPPGGDRSR